MRDALKVELTAYTGSFRVPGLVAYQLSLPLPPLSTVFGLLAAAAGEWVPPSRLEWVGYRCDYEARGKDLEAIITFERKGPRDVARAVQRNVVWREFLVNPRLTLYLPCEWEKAFRRPRYPLVLGRSQDVATVERLEKVRLSDCDEGELSGTLLPLDVAMTNGIGGIVFNLPVAFDQEPVRTPLGVRAFTVLDAKEHRVVARVPGWLCHEPGTEFAVPLYRREWIMSVMEG